MDKLTDLLKRSGVITEAQLDLAIQKQRVLGGTPSLYLLADGLIAEDVLQSFLAQVYPLPEGCRYDADPQPEALGLLDRDRAARLQVIPVNVESDTLFVLAVTPDNEEMIREVRKRSGIDQVVACPVNELRFLWHLEQWYGIDTPEYLRPAMDRLFAEDGAPAKSQATSGAQADELLYDPMAGLGTGLSDQGLMAQIPMSAGTDSAEEIIPILDEELPLLIVESPEEAAAADQLEASASKGPLGEGLDPLPLEDMEKALSAVQSLDDLYRVFLRFGAPYLDSLVVFKVQGDQVSGWRAAGPTVDSSAAKTIVEPVDSAQIFAPAAGAGPVVLTDRPKPGDQALAGKLGASENQTIVSDAVSVRGRAVLLVCGALSEQAAPDQVAAELHTLCALASGAVVRIIVKKKKGA